MAPFKKAGLGIATFVALAALFVGLTLLANATLRNARLDLTQNKLYSLAPGTERLVGQLKEPINLYFYFSQQSSAAAPALRAYAVRVRELLEELAARSGGQLKLHVIDPQPYSEDEDRATEAGLRRSPSATAPTRSGSGSRRRTRPTATRSSSSSSRRRRSSSSTTSRA